MCGYRKPKKLSEYFVRANIFYKEEDETARPVQAELTQHAEVSILQTTSQGGNETGVPPPSESSNRNPY